MPTTPPSPSVSFFFLIFSLLDPRRWLGILFSIFGMLASVVAPLLPARITKPLFHPSTIVVLPRRPHTRSASQASKVPIVTSPVPILSNRRHTSLGLTRSRPRFSPRASPLASTAKIEFGATSSLGVYQSEDLTYNTPPNSLTTSQTYVLNTRVGRRQSLESLDLATSTVTTPPVITALRQPVFHVLDSTGRQRRLSPDYYPLADRTTSTLVTNPIPSASEVEQDTAEWRGSSFFAVKRCVAYSNPAEALPVRRKFRLFQRENSVPSTSSLEVLPRSASVSSLVLNAPSAETSPLSSTAPSHSPDSDAGPGAVISEQLLIPPERPMRTDPYKKFNIPAPGTERAMAFLKAEKEWVKAETERRKKESARSVPVGKRSMSVSREVMLESEKSDIVEGKKSTNCGHRRRRSFPASRKSTTDDEPPSFELEKTSEDNETLERPKLLIPQTYLPDEFGVLPAPLSAVPEENSPVAPGDANPQLEVADSPETSAPQQQSQASLQGKRLWVFSKRPKSRDEETKEKWKKEETDEKKPKRQKSRDSKIKAPRINLMGVKEGGYVSDTAVSSLTYQLISY